MDPVIEQWLMVVSVIVMIFLPALAITTRIALRPIVEALIRVREGLIGIEESAGVDARLDKIEQQLAHMNRIVERVGAAQQFDIELRAGERHRELTAEEPRQGKYPDESDTGDWRAKPPHGESGWPRQ